MSQWIARGALALGLVAVWPTVHLQAGNPHVFRFEAEWQSNADGGDCDSPASVLSLVSSQADVDVVVFVHQINLDPCNPTSPLQTAQGTGQVEIRGNQAHLFVEGTLAVGDDGEVNIDLKLRKTGNLPDPLPGEKLWSARAEGEVVLDGTNLTGGRPSTRAQISRSKL